MGTGAKVSLPGAGGYAVESTSGAVSLTPGLNDELKEDEDEEVTSTTLEEDNYPDTVLPENQNTVHTIISDPLFQETFEISLAEPRDVIYDVERPTGWLARQIEEKVREAGLIEGISNEELQLSVDNPLAAIAVSENREVADEYLAEMFDGHVDGNDANAFRHAMFAALNTLALGSRLASDFANAHENREGNDSEDQRDDGIKFRSLMEMDLHNNALGIAIAQTMLVKSPSGFVNYDDLAEMVYDIVIIQEAGEWIIE